MAACGRSAEIQRAAAELCRRAGYTNAGTVEFLYSPESRQYHFMEVNARLQVEHPVTEQTTGLDLVKLQVQMARGDRLDGEPPAPSGHAIGPPPTPEHPTTRSPRGRGRSRCSPPPAGPGVRVDAGVAEGDEIAAE